MKLKKIGRVYHAEVKTADGRRSTITTHSTDKAEAARIVEESGIKQLEQSAKAGRLTNEAVGRITTGRKLTMTKALEAWKEWMESIGKAPRTIYNNATIVIAWLHEKHIENLPPSAINEKHIASWINNATSDTKGHTRAVKLASIRTFFTFLSARGWCIGDPSRLVRVRMDILSHEQKETTEKVPFTTSEVNRLVRYLREKYTDKKATEETKTNALFWEFAVRISDEIGLRLGDICQLEWECFTKAGRVVVWTDKRDKRVSVPISDKLSELITEIPVHSPQYLFPEQRGLTQDVKRRALLSMQFKRICERNEITGKSFHSLRHTCITRWASEGKSLELIGKDVGHAHESTTRGYVH